MLNIIKTIFNILAIFCYIAVGIYLFISAPIVAGYHPVVVLSGSMEPHYPVGSVLYYKKQSFEAIRVGNVITFELGSKGTLVTHRVAQVNGLSRTFVTKGDANKTDDMNPVSYANVKGVVAAYQLPYAGYYVAYVNQHLYLIVLIVVLLLAKIALSYVGNEKEDQPLKSTTSE